MQIDSDDPGGEAGEFAEELRRVLAKWYEGATVECTSADPARQGEKMKSVRIEKNRDGTYSAYIYDHCIFTGTYAECVRELSYHGESV